ncbi:immunoglobulin-like domain-containing protein [uncultured Oscillibacter sp.]|uniref:immunoglobulin-like domain-containing protein n=1 Tax=uncultured Oscillibacter sp. TaxID=876091 RepID=UPI0025FFA740|nr:immunoglobulin-like domain-containing protein [uncultured Oscillibacter sp.]
MRKRFWLLGLLAAVLAVPVRAEEAAVTRGVFVQSLYAAHEVRLEGEEPAEPATAAEAVAWAAELGVLQGYGGDILALDAPITRAQAAVMLYRYAGTLAPPPETPADALAGYGDAGEVPGWCRREVGWAVAGDLWFSGSAARLGIGDGLTAAECQILLEALYQGGIPLADGTEPESCATADLTAEPSAGAVTVTLHNQGTDYLLYGADYRLYQRINGGWYHRSAHWGWTLLAYSLGPGERSAWELAALPAGEYRVEKAVYHMDGRSRETKGTEPCLLTVEITIS